MRAGKGEGEREARGAAIPIVSIVGRSGSGKTTLLERLIPELRDRGVRVATIKHDAHGFEIDRVGKDTWRHRHAGATVAILSSGRLVATFQDVTEDLTLEMLRGRFVRDVDLILAEGYRREDHPKIEVYRAALGPGLLCGAADRLLAVVADAPVETEAPCFGHEDVKAIADLIETEVLG
ncbi:MAG: molybdopterin-guanine dinucleotide biosynthesis protein B [Deltaproteobacteria bacterium]|nr:molybdopterin-guanine dinucleotide biosynthesis protein B [Deltaproteobacteria bacterium]